MSTVKAGVVVRVDIADDIGLDPARYIASIHQDSEKQFHTFESQITDKERFKDSEAFNVRCMGCEGSFVFDGLSENQVSACLKKRKERIDIPGQHCTSDRRRVPRLSSGSASSFDISAARECHSRPCQPILLGLDAV